MARMLEAERERRIEQVGAQGMRRMLQKDLALGWTSWHDHWLFGRRQRQLLAQAGARLVKPRLVAAFKFWCADWV
eukprot:5428017-Prymnesium_polylepis.1